MTGDRNRRPATIWQALRRLLACNKSQLAERLGVTRQTLARWEADEAAGAAPSDHARRAAQELLRAVLANVPLARDCVR